MCRVSCWWCRNLLWLRIPVRGVGPSLSSAAVPEEGQRLYLEFVDRLKESGLPLATGEFGADMQVHLIKDGPVTINVGGVTGVRKLFRKAYALL